ncbi:MAG: MFS transporter [Candidatus Eremiobacteraeota bacterium]|nr:MFS transporter [Candidatus Eremiobacteraeota bacterium]
MKFFNSTINRYFGVTFRALKHRNFCLYWFGQILSVQGTWMQMVALGWLVLRITDSPFLLGLAGMAGNIPILFLILPAGVISDRISKQKVLLFTQTGLAIQAVILAILTLTDLIDIYLILILSVISGILRAIDMPARHSFVVEMVGKEDLMNAISLNSTLFNLARIIAPAIAGFLIALWGEGLCFAINALSYITMVGALLAMHSLPKTISLNNEKNIFAEVFDGLKFIKTSPVVLSLLILISSAAFFGVSSFVLMPIFARDILKVGARGLGFLMSAQGFGALLAAITIASLDYRTIYRKMFYAAVILLPTFIFLFSFSGNFWISIFLILGAGWELMILQATANTTIQLKTPDDIRGRIMGIYGFTFLGFMPLGQLQVGAIAQWLDVRWAIALNALICMIVAIIVYRKVPQLKKVQENILSPKEVETFESKKSNDEEERTAKKS